jgi:hypothetical protein
MDVTGNEKGTYHLYYKMVNFVIKDFKFFTTHGKILTFSVLGEWLD